MFGDTLEELERLLDDTKDDTELVFIEGTVFNSLKNAKNELGTNDFSETIDCLMQLVVEQYNYEW